MNHLFEKHVTECKAEFREFKHRYLLRHVKKHIVPKLAKRWFAEADRLDDFHDEATSQGETLRACAKELCTSKILGTIIVFYDSEGLRVGFSKVHPGAVDQRPDRYNRHIGIMKAIKNAYSEEVKPVPRALQEPMSKMIEFAESEKGMNILGEK